MKISRIITLCFTMLFVLFSTQGLSAGSKKILREKSFDVKSGETIFVKAEGGDIGVKAWEKNEVYIKIVGNKRAEKKVKFTFKRTDNGIQVKAERKNSGWFNWGGMNYRILIRVPKVYNTELKTSGGDVKLIGLEGRHSVKTSGGDIYLKKVTGKAELKTSGGDIEIEEGETDILASTSGGDIYIDVKDGKIDAKTSGGDIKIYLIGENKGVYAGTSGGDIILFLSPEVKADALFKTAGGEVDVDFYNASAEVIKPSKYVGAFNGGGNKIELKTSGGDIFVKSK